MGLGQKLLRSIDHAEVDTLIEKVGTWRLEKQRSTVQSELGAPRIRLPEACEYVSPGEEGKRYYKGELWHASGRFVYTASRQGIFFFDGGLGNSIRAVR
jgi:hypothetical protein